MCVLNIIAQGYKKLNMNVNLRQQKKSEDLIHSHRSADQMTSNNMIIL